MMDYNKAKPDDRSDNAEKLEQMVQNTYENIEKAEETIQFSDGENIKKLRIKMKNAVLV